MNRRVFLILGLSMPIQLALATEPRSAVLYKNPQCGCCEDYAKYLRQSGYAVQVVATHDLDAIKAKHGVPEKLSGCHTTLIDGYVVEGHVPVPVIERLLKERPAIRGISLPGMPAGSPGMTGRKREPFKIYSIDTRPSFTPAIYAVD